MSDHPSCWRVIYERDNLSNALKPLREYGAKLGWPECAADLVLHIIAEHQRLNKFRRDVQSVKNDPEMLVEYARRGLQELQAQEETK